MFARQAPNCKHQELEGGQFQACCLSNGGIDANGLSIIGIVQTPATDASARLLLSY